MCGGRTLDHRTLERFVVWSNLAYVALRALSPARPQAGDCGLTVAPLVRAQASDAHQSQFRHFPDGPPGPPLLLAHRARARHLASSAGLGAPLRGTWKLWAARGVDGYPRSTCE